MQYLHKIKDCLSLKLMFCLAIILFVTGCAQTMSQIVPLNVYSIKNDQNTVAEEGYGFFLMAVTTNKTINELLIKGPMNFTLTQDDLKKGSNYILLTLPEGEYAIKKIITNRSKSVFNGNDYWNFTVKANTISYIGDLNAQFLGRWGFRQKYELVNRSSYALEFLEDNYPQLLSRNTAVYSGYGEDQFLEIMTRKVPTVQPETVKTASVE